MRTLNPHLQRADMLLAQRRFDQAEEHARRAIGEDPQLAVAYSYLALCLSHREQHAEAVDAARRGVALAPDDGYGQYVLALVLHDRDDELTALDAVQESLRLEPDHARSWALLGSINLSLRRWRDALAAAESGLKFDAEHEGCVNVRGAALARLGRTGEAGQAIDATLARNPENATSHANMGWTLLHRHEPRKAMEHFREALRLEPGLETARAGIVEAMKARNVVYRLFLAYFLFMNRMSSRAQWGVLVGGYIGFQVVRNLTRQYPEAAPFLNVLIVAYVAFALGTVLAYPLFNLLLSLSKFGRLALSREQRIAAYILGLTLLAALTAAVVWGCTGNVFAELAALITPPLAIPIALAGQARCGVPRVAMGTLAAGLAVVAVFIVAGPAVEVRTAPFVLPYMLMCFLSTWLANILSTLRARPKR